MKNKKLLGVTGLAVVALVGGSLAYFNQTMEVENPFDTNKYGSELVEDFHPGDGENWQPGATVNKDIEVKNTGDYDVLTRVKFDETWTRKGEDSAYKTNKGMNNTTSQADATDGLTEADGSIVTKTLNATEWVYNPSDGYWYYKHNLTAGSSTGNFLDSVTLLEEADMGKYVVTKYYTTADEEPANDVIGEDPATQWVKYEGEVPDNAKHTRTVTAIEDGKEGYSNSDYKLTITAQTVQATEDAVQDAFELTTLEGTDWTLTK